MDFGGPWSGDTEDLEEVLLRRMNTESVEAVFQELERICPLPAMYQMPHGF